MKCIKFTITSSLQAPLFIGSMIRGAMGGALKEVVCVNPSFECKDCFAKDNCLYYEFYEQKNRFLNYRLDFKLNPKNIEFSYYLFNEACSKYPYILSAIEKLFTKKGLGVRRETTNDFKIYYKNELIYDGNNFKNIKIKSTHHPELVSESKNNASIRHSELDSESHSKELTSHSKLVSESHSKELTSHFKLVSESQNNASIRHSELDSESNPKPPTIIKLKLTTPLRLKKNGRFLKPDTLDIKDILISIIGKKAFFENSQKENIEQFPTVVMKDLKFIDLTRYSNRQKTKMKVGGIIGEMVISNLTPQTYNLLKYGEITGVGKLNSFGLGIIEIENLT